MVSKPQKAMSLHAELNSTAIERLRNYRRNSVVSSIVIAFLVIVMVCLGLGILLLPSLLKDDPDDFVIYVPRSIEDKVDPPVKPQRTRNHEPSSPATHMSKVMLANTTSPTTLPVTEVDVTVPSLDFGAGAEIGTGWDKGPGDGDFTGIDPRVKKRCSLEDRMARLKEMGGTAACEDAVMKALRWIKQTQNSDGSWGDSDQVAMTGFAILAYLGHCETPASPEFGESVTRGIAYLVNNGLKNDGRLTVHPEASIRWVYEHAIATYALAEAYTFCRTIEPEIPDLDTVTQKAAEIIMDGQGESGGWVYRYAPTKDGDNSVGFWQIQALKACSHTGLWPESKFKRYGRKALGWLEKAQGDNGAIGYRGDPTRSPGLTGGGVLAFQLWGEGRSKNARSGIQYIAANQAFKWGDASSNLYYHYYNAQAMINHGGKHWEAYNKLFRDELLKNQQPDGSWNQGNMSHGPVNAHMATCLATLMLEVYYRFLPGTGSAS
jgi:hypothetical protein